MVDVRLKLLWGVALVAVILCMVYLEKTSAVTTEKLDDRATYETSGNHMESYVESFEESDMESDIESGVKTDAYDVETTKSISMSGQIEESPVIRVLLCTSQYTSKVHQSVSVTSEYAFTLTTGEDTHLFSPGEIVEIDAQSTYLNVGQAVIESSLNIDSSRQTDATEDTPEDARLTILSIERSCGHPSYRGKLILTRVGDAIRVVNELPIEDYLYGVVPSEMPASYHLEALKAQAICARCFAYTSLTSDKYADEGANLDDSMASQVYMNCAEDTLTNQAVDDTRGMLLYYGDEIVRTYFYSTSCGVTSDVFDVWSGTESELGDYLKPVFLNIDEALPAMAVQSFDLSDEQQFHTFIDTADTENYYESNVPWFRWQVSIDYDNLMKGVSTVSSAYKSGTIHGKITDIKVGERGTSGIVKTLVIHSEGETLEIYGEYNIRKALNISKQLIICRDGTKFEGQTMLPSAYFYIEAVKDDWILHGGGFGHGVGLSQNGAQAMSEDGLDCEEILACFYPNTKLRHSNEIPDRSFAN